MKKMMFLILILFVIGCTKTDRPVKPSPEPHDKERQTITYQESDADFANPERGFYETSLSYSGNFTFLDENLLKNNRVNGINGAGGYIFFPTLILRSYVLDEFKSGSVSADFLNNMEQDFNSARSAGVKLILLYSYVYQELPDRVDDAPLEVVLTHIEQIKPLLNEYKDVIATVQEGFIGTWGENGGSDYFGMPEWDNNVPLSVANWEDRNQVLQALLRAVPEDRMVQVRYPVAKQRFVFGPESTIFNSSALPENEAFSGTDISRIGFHNNCFLANSHDAGTYFDMGNGTTAPNYSLDDETVEILKNYTAEDSKYVVVGGETCNGANPQFFNCEVSPEAMRQFHWSYLCMDYHQGVLGSWVDNGCMDEISRNLGYRFVLKNLTIDKNSSAGKSLFFSLTLENKGNASPYNPRPVRIVMVNSATGKETTFDLNTDIREWFRGEIFLEESLTMPSDLPRGTYKVFLSLPDASSKISDRPEYSIRLANENVWNQVTGYNDLQATVEIL